MNNLDDYRRRSIVTSTMINNNPSRKFVWREALSGVELTLTPFEYVCAVMELNRIFSIRGYVSVEDFLHLLGYDGKNPINGGLGWSIDIAAADGWDWIDVKPEFIEKDGIFFIDYIIQPEIDYMEAWE